MSSILTPKPFNEPERIEALQALKILDTPREAAFDRITRIAASVMRVQTAFVSLVDTDRQWFKSCHGIDIASSPREIAFCAHAILKTEALVILDATKGPRFADNPFVTGEAGLRFYCGMPLTTRDGFRIGTLCVIDGEPRAEVTESELGAMRDLADMTMEAIEGRDALRNATDALSQHISTAQKQAESGETAKANLMAMLGHELRTPLNAIIGFSEVMTGQAFGQLGSPHYVEYAEHIRDSGRHLLGLIGTLLNFASCERGEITLAEEEFDTTDVIEECAGMMSERARNADIELELEVATDLFALRADRNQVVQMLLNLIGNAIKFSHSGGAVRIAAKCVAGQIVIAVVDKGIGMSPDQLEKSRGVFDQLESGLARRFEGLGLGLPLTERLIELHGGKLEMQSAADEGTTAKLTFPAWRSIHLGNGSKTEAARAS